MKMRVEIGVVEKMDCQEFLFLLTIPKHMFLREEMKSYKSVILPLELIMTPLLVSL